VKQFERSFRVLDSSGVIWFAFEVIETRERMPRLFRLLGFGRTSRFTLSDGRTLTRQPDLSYCSSDGLIYWEIPPDVPELKS